MVHGLVQRSLFGAAVLSGAALFGAAPPAAAAVDEEFGSET